jgi:uncharacterized protein YdhG (YjbR/CyaY superfamily)
MQSKARRVDQYLTEVPSERLEALTEIRELCLATLDGYDESMVYGMPSYSKDNVIEVAFASQKSYISLYILKEEVLNEYRDRMKGIDTGKGCIRYTKPEKIDFEIVKQLLVATVKSDAEIC